MAPTPKSFQQTLQELWQLLRAYAQQETIGPLKNLGRQLGYGIAGAFLVALGIYLLVLGVMRGLQSHTLPSPIGSWFHDHDWSIYLIAVFILGVVCFLCFKKAKAKPLASSTTIDLVEDLS